ncbi:MAG: adenylate/guanylate cyclase domain-containing protein, partial [Pseudomonadota bacterium]
MTLQRWLEERRLGHVAELLLEHDIDLDILPDLSEEDLAKLGMSLGDRRRLTKAARTLRVQDNVPAAGPDVGPPVVAPAERRQVTIMFCDLVGSTALAESLDPEDMREVLRGYRQLCAQLIGGHQGTIVRYIGDGVLACFGYPIAHEDDAIRAIYAGLEVTSQLPDLQGPPGPDGPTMLSARIGIHTGMVVAGEIGSGDPSDSVDLVGGTPNVAARLQEVATPNAVVISDSTHKLAQGRFVCDSLGDHALKGITEPVEVFRVKAESRASSRFEVAMQAGLTPLVDRQEEIALLHDRWRRAQAGEGQVTLVSGEAGIGKSRVVQALRERIQHEPHFRQRCQCSPHHGTSALHPVIRHLEDTADFAADDSSEVKLEKLMTTLKPSSINPAEDIHPIASLLSIPTDITRLTHSTSQLQDDQHGTA